tara:strand:- start:44 stop:430 length:387 start_codon:yes stop_codon:yes gene_type:complete
MSVLLLIWILIAISALTALGSAGQALIGGPIRCIFRERSQSVLLFLSSLSLLAILFTVLGLSDIRKDYAGSKLHIDGTPIQSFLPEYARCELEWSIVVPAVFTIILAQSAIMIFLTWQHRDVGSNTPA